MGVNIYIALIIGLLLLAVQSLSYKQAAKQLETERTHELALISKKIAIALPLLLEQNQAEIAKQIITAELQNSFLESIQIYNKNKLLIDLQRQIKSNQIKSTAPIQFETQANTSTLDKSTIKITYNNEDLSYKSQKQQLSILLYSLPTSIILFIILMQLIKWKFIQPISQIKNNLHQITTNPHSHCIYPTENKETHALSYVCTQLHDHLIDRNDNDQQSSQTISVTSEEIAATAAEFASSMSAQNASLMRSNVSMSEISKSINTNTEHAKSTHYIAKESATRAKEGHVLIQQTISAIASINSKISIIDDLAYQTNILALNAAIEAARAGIHGRGFDVVAQEVRRLANRSQTAAGDIETLVKQGINSSNEVGHLFGDLSYLTEETERFVEDIALNSSKQSHNLSQLNQENLQISLLMNHLSSSSEELSDTAHELGVIAERHLRNLEQPIPDSTEAINNPDAYALPPLIVRHG
ncbi:methyl-accepting chemotaxis protein [uncultured Deefgea sp.]|uniref:methyl-accepting chemotaxis protein n=1 Tax=uncultured Deefgea sp. TaxID=1304914 RepID=UPI0026165F80|nr:methyl-accepting chemotaxis protein [uncultured Deefgea sp.]